MTPSHCRPKTLPMLSIATMTSVVLFFYKKPHTHTNDRNIHGQNDHNLYITKSISWLAYLRCFCECEWVPTRTCFHKRPGSHRSSARLPHWTHDLPAAHTPLGRRGLKWSCGSTAGSSWSPRGWRDRSADAHTGARMPGQLWGHLREGERQSEQLEVFTC